MTRIKNPFWLYIVCAFSLISHAALAQAQHAQSDFDGDGLSDFTVIKILDDGTLSWRARTSADNSLSTLGTLGISGNHIVLGYWSNSRYAEMASVSKSGDGSVLWSVKGHGASDLNFSLGTSSSLVLSGADFNRSGYTDAAVAEKSGGRYLWKIKLDPLAPSGARTVRSFKFGLANSKLFYVNPDGKRDWLAYFTKQGGSLWLRLRNVGTAKGRTIKVRGAPSMAIRPVPVKKSDGSDALAFISKRSNSTRVIVRELNGKQIASHTFNATGDVIVGNFISAAGEQIAVMSGEGFLVFNPKLKSVSVVSATSGVAVDQVNINSFASEEAPPSATPTPVVGGACVSRVPTDGGGGFVWKPNSDTQFYAACVLPAEFTGQTSELKIYSGAGVYIKSLNFKGVGNGNRTAWQDTSMTGANYRDQYRSIVVRLITKNNSCYTWSLSDPSRRYD